MPAGRPTLYTPELLEKAEDYILNYAQHGHAIPSVVGMAIVINVAESTLYNWADDEDTEFLGTLSKCKDHQHHALLNGGLNNTLNAGIVKLALGNHAGYSEKTDNTLSGPDGGPIETENHWTIEVVESDGE